MDRKRLVENCFVYQEWNMKCAHEHTMLTTSGYIFSVMTPLCVVIYSSISCSV